MIHSEKKRIYFDFKTDFVLRAETILSINLLLIQFSVWWIVEGVISSYSSLRLSVCKTVPLLAGRYKPSKNRSCARLKGVVTNCIVRNWWHSSKIKSRRQKWFKAAVNVEWARYSTIVSSMRCKMVGEWSSLMILTVLTDQFIFNNKRGSIL